MTHKNCPMCGKKAIETIFSFDKVGIKCSNRHCGICLPVSVAPWKEIPKRLMPAFRKDFKDFEKLIRLESYVKAWKLWNKRVK